MHRRLEDRIRALCAKALKAENCELDAIFSELKSALGEHNRRLRKLAAAKLVRATGEQPQERRVAA
jgi:hypothetical protein